MDNKVARRFLGTARLYGYGAATAFANSSVAIVGLGGVGSWSAEALARSGIGRLILIDFDHIAESNINRQIHALDTTLGKAKIAALAERLKLINPSGELVLVDDFVTAENCTELLATDLSGIIDACDQSTAKLAIIEFAKRHKIASICVGASGGKRQPQLAQIADLSAATHDPLLSKIRYSYRKKHKIAAGKNLHIPVVYSTEQITKPQSDCAIDAQEPTTANLNCHGYGSSVAVTATFGMCAAGWLLNKLAAKS